MTAHIVEDVVEKCYASGMNDCISKPFQLEALVNKINNLCKLETKVNSDNEFNSNEKYIKIFSTNFIDDLKKLEKCEKNNDTEGVLSLLHKIKGSSFTMGYESLGNAISQMEQKKLVDLELLEKLFRQSINQK
jgi:HPt (histidine-containing phosphotransfer) domain-containing protein